MPQLTGAMKNGWRAWIRQTLDEMKQKWTSARGAAISRSLDAYYQSDRIWFVAHPQLPAEAALWVDRTWPASNVIRINLGQNQAQARTLAMPGRAWSPSNPGGWMVLGDTFIQRRNLVVSLAHEGLHAALAREGACLEEEVDGRLAGNAAARALRVGGTVQVSLGGLAAACDALKDDYPDLNRDPTYVPLGGSWPNPWTIAY